MTTLEAIQRVVLRGLSRNAVKKLANRLCDAGLLQKYTLLYPVKYFVLGELAVRNFGIGIHRAESLGPQSLQQEFALLAFATLGTHQHLRLNAAEVKHRCPWLPLVFTAAPHCIDEANVLELVRVDLGGPAHHVVRKCAADLTRLPQFAKERQCFRGFWGKSFHYIFFWIIFEGSLRRSFSSRIC